MVENWHVWCVTHHWSPSPNVESSEIELNVQAQRCSLAHRPIVLKCVCALPEWRPVSMVLRTGKHTFAKQWNVQMFNFYWVSRHCNLVPSHLVCIVHMPYPKSHSRWNITVHFKALKKAKSEGARTIRLRCAAQSQEEKCTFIFSCGNKTHSTYLVNS